MFVDIILKVAEVYLFLYDLVTYPIYQVLLQISSKQKANDTSTPRAYMVKESSEEIIWRRDVSTDKAIYKEIILDHKVFINQSTILLSDPPMGIFFFAG